jgi:hypothetical protein
MEAIYDKQISANRLVISRDKYYYLIVIIKNDVLPIYPETLHGRAVDLAFSTVEVAAMPTRYAIRILGLIGILITVVLMAGFSAQAENVTLTLEAGPYEIVSDGITQTVKMDGFGNVLVPGKPMLPARTFMIALPRGARVSSVTTHAPSAHEIEGRYAIRPATAVLPNIDREAVIRECREQWRRNYQAAYSSDAPFPPVVGQYCGTGALRKYTFARVAYAPFSYHPQSGRLVFNPSLTVSIEYTVPPGDPARAKVAFADTKGDRLASRLFVNYPQAAEWYRPPALSRAPQDVADYVIITTTALASSVDPLVAWKESLGYAVDVVTTSWITANYTGADLPERIRNFLIANYLEWGIEYVLLVGDIYDIPMRLCYPNPDDHTGYSEYCPPTDYYYAELTSDWDSDGDGYPGEYGQDNIDFIPEVAVGRLPFSNSALITSVCNKLVAFESDATDWKDNALLIGAMSNYANENNSGLPRTDGAELMEEMVGDMLSGWSTIRMYEKSGYLPCPYPADLPLNQANVVDTWSAGDFGIVNWWAHGSEDAAWRKWWDFDDGDGIPEGNEMYWSTFFENGDVPGLDYDHPSIIFSCACNNAWLEFNSLAQNLLSHGSAGMVASTRVSWYNEGWTDELSGGNASLDYYFFHYLIAENENVGDALVSAKVFYLNNLYWSFADPVWTPQQNILDFCLFGDPALARKRICNCGVWGDVTDDGAVNPVDVVYLVNFVYKSLDARIQPPACPYEAGDVDCNTQVNPVDVVYLVNYVYKSLDALCRPCLQ